MQDTRTADAIVDQALAANPNYIGAWMIRGLISAYLGNHERALDQLLYAMRLNPIDPNMQFVEGGMAMANLMLHRQPDALFWVTKALARTPNYAPALRFGVVAHAIEGRNDEAQKMLASLRRIGGALTISEYRKFSPFQRAEDVEVMINGFRIAGVPE